MHVALISPGWPIGAPNGIVTYVHHLRDGLLSVGHRVTVLAFSVNPSGDLAGVYRIEGGWRTRKARLLNRLPGMDGNVLALQPLMIADTVMRINRRETIDVVEMEESFGWFAEVQQRVSMPVVTKLHGPAFLTQVEQASPSAELLGRITREGFALQKAKFVYAPSADTISKAFDRYGIKHLPQIVIPNPVSAPTEASQLWSADRCDRRLLLFVGRFERIKGADYLLKSFRIMLDSDPSLRLMFVGPIDGTINCDGKQMTISACVEAWFGAEFKHTVIVTGPMPASSIQELRLQAVVTLVTSRWENQPNTALEAMAQGCPVVAVAVGGIREVIENGKTGVLVAPDSEAQFAQATLRLIADLDQASERGARAREYVQRVHAPSSIATRTAELYEVARSCYRSTR